MATKSYDFNERIRHRARQRAAALEYDSQEVHHIVPKSFAKKHDLPRKLIVSEANAIALSNELHCWIHGFINLSSSELTETMGEMSEVERQIEDEELDWTWRGLNDEDYEFLATAYLGINEQFFQ